MTHDANNAPAAGGGGGFNPREAAALLDQTTRQARRQLEPAQPWLLPIRAVLVLAALGTVWLSVRGQHPYRGPTRNDAFVIVAFVVINFLATLTVRRRATAGVSGRTPLNRTEIAILVGAWVVVVVVIVALASAKVSDSVVYGLYPVTVPLIVPGLAWAGVMAARADWRSFGTGVAVVAVGIASGFAGPAGAWAVAGIGLCVAMLGTAAVIAWRLRRA